MRNSHGCLLLLISISVLVRQELNGQAIETKQTLVSQLLKYRPLADVDDLSLTSLLDSLQGSQGITPFDGTYLDFSCPQRVVYAIRLKRSGSSSTQLYLFYLPNEENYFFSEMSPAKADGEAADLRIWAEEEQELVITEREAFVLRAPSARTFRLRSFALKRDGVSRRDLSPGEFISCVARTIGVDVNPASFITALSSVTCSTLNTMATIETVLHCFSMVSVGVANVTSTAGCITGLATLVSCGVANCTSTSTAQSIQPACLSAIALNSSVRGSWSSSCDSMHRTGSYARYYRFSLSARTRVQVDVQSNVDTYLYLLRGGDQNGAVVASDDDGGSGTDSRITVELSAGDYTVEATTYRPGQAGTFGISVATQSASTPSSTLSSCIGSISLGATVNGAWSSDCASAHRADRYARFYTFSVASRRRVQIDLVSSVDTYLFLLQGNRADDSIIEADDDGGSGSNSRIIRTLDAGTYTVEATTFSTSRTGSFTLSVR